MRAVTDAGPTEMNQTMPEPIQNIFTLLEIVSEKEIIDHFREEYATCKIRYGDLKKQLAEDIIQAIAPIREKIKELYANDAYLAKITRMGTEKARESASKTLKEVREIIGHKAF